jgi:hypothetical protein
MNKILQDQPWDHWIGQVCLCVCQKSDKILNLVILGVNNKLCLIITQEELISTRLIYI